MLVNWLIHHVMPASGDRVRERLSEGLRARMQGKSCFSFVHSDEALLKELEQLMAWEIAAFERAGFIFP